jgi:uncharacterized protein with HEPN domain
MTSSRVPTLIWDARRAAHLVMAFVAGKNFDQYMADDMLRSAVERQFGIIGEALNAVRRLDPALAVSIPDLHQIIAFRNIIIHGYDIVDHGTVWKASQESLLPLLDVLERLQKELDQD